MIKKKLFSIVLLAVAAVLLALAPATQADIALPDSGVVGPYRVVFVTSAYPAADATVTMAELNAWVASLAVTSGLDTAAGSPGWYVVGATTAVDVFTNTGLAATDGVPVYYADGVLFAADNAALWALGAVAEFDTNEYGVFGDSGNGSWTHTGLATLDGLPITASGNELDSAGISMGGKDAGYGSWYGTGSSTWAGGIDNGSLITISGVIGGGVGEAPADGDLEVDSLTLTELSWRLPADPNVGTEVYVWFGDEQIDDNLIVDGEIGTTSISLDAANIDLDSLTDYTWHIEFIDPNDADTITGNKAVLLSNNTFTFRTLTSNQAPTVEVPDFYTWVKEDGVLIDTAVITDPDGTSQHISYTWSVLDGPAGATAGFSPNGTKDAVDTVATFTVAGDYVLQVEVNDNDEYTITGTVNVKVYEDGCEAAKAELPYSELDAREKGDTNYDCEVNTVDLATMALNWLDNLLE